MLLTRIERELRARLQDHALAGVELFALSESQSTAQDGGGLVKYMYVGRNPMVRKFEALNDYFKHGRVAGQRRHVRPWNNGCPFPTTASPRADWQSVLSQRRTGQGDQGHARRSVS